jgi:hypothetical protein
MKPPGAARSTFVLNVLGIGLVLALSVLTYVRLTKTTSMGLTGRREYALEDILVAGLWMWIAIKSRSGRRWARIAGTIAFALWLLPVIADSAAFVSLNGLDGWQIASGVLVFLAWIVGLMSVLTMWRKSSGAVFTPAGATTDP